MKTIQSIANRFSPIAFCVILLITIVSTSCNKEHDEARTWEGRVLEYGTEKPVPGARILLQDSEGEILGPVSYFIIDSATTDNQGRFSFRTKNNVAGMRAVVTKDNYFRTFAYKSTATNFNIIIDPHAWLRVKVEKEGEIEQYDRFNMESFKCEPKSFRLDLGVTSCLCQLAGNKTHNMKYFRLPTGGQFYGAEFFETFVKGHDTTEVIIKF